MKITVETLVDAPVSKVWSAYTTPEDIKQWNSASDDWHTTASSVDLRPGGAFSSRMEAKDGSFGFDFAGTYTRIVPNKLIEYSFGDRVGQVEFLPGSNGVTVRVTFDGETTHPEEQQRQGWQAILNRFAKHVSESLKSRLNGACHCGSVKFHVKLSNGLKSARRCNCSYCRMRGAVAVSANLDDIVIEAGKEVLTLYQFNTNTAKHYFCSRCGIYTHHQRRSNPREYGVNVACLEGVSPFDLTEVPVLDGVNHPADGPTRGTRSFGVLKFIPND